MQATKTADRWFAEYGESHQNHTNELVHWFCVPVIFFCVIGLVRAIPVPGEFLEAAPWFRWNLPAMALALLFYLRLSPRLAAGLLLFMAGCDLLLAWQELACPVPIWKTCLALFILAWVGQFIGHKIEGKKPSFFKDLVFLLIGPAWLMHFIYRKLGLRY